ncbi:MAG: class I SAM-dependent methyltransferase [Bacteroidales bacterium]|nr:class I SAM-dependent methyltransferase [Bacteroidales bacterium]
MNEKQNKSCPICDSTQTQKIINWDRYSINHCRQCKLIYSDPFPTNQFLKDFYQGFLFNIPDKRNIEKQIETRKQELNTLFKFSKERKKFLDYGGGTGSAYKAACELNLVSYYHDLDNEAEAFVRKEHGLTNDFIIDKIKNSHIYFDYIFSDNVIEHLINPIDYVKEMREMLTDGGEIIIKTPHGKNTESYFYPLITIKGYFLRTLKYNSLSKSLQSCLIRFWHCDPPRHLYSFSDLNLRIIAKKAGFKESEVEILYYHIPLFKYSLLSIFLNFRKYHSLKSFLLRILILPVLPFEIMSKIIQYGLLKINLLTPGGIILKLKKRLN